MSAVKHIGASGECERNRVQQASTVMYYAALVR
jgi:hypothetical protein